MGRANDRFYISLDCDINNSIKSINNASTGDKEPFQCVSIHIITQEQSSRELIYNMIYSKFGEDIERRTIRHGRIASAIEMKTIPAVIPRSNLRSSRRVPNNRIIINDRIKTPTNQDSLTLSLVGFWVGQEATVRVPKTV